MHPNRKWCCLEVLVVKMWLQTTSEMPIQAEGLRGNECCPLGAPKPNTVHKAMKQTEWIDVKIETNRSTVVGAPNPNGGKLSACLDSMAIIER